MCDVDDGYRLQIAVIVNRNVIVVSTSYLVWPTCPCLRSLLLCLAMASLEVSGFARTVGLSLNTYNTGLIDGVPRMFRTQSS